MPQESHKAREPLSFPGEVRARFYRSRRAALFRFSLFEPSALSLLHDTLAP